MRRAFVLFKYLTMDKADLSIYLNFERKCSLFTLWNLWSIVWRQISVKNAETTFFIIGENGLGSWVFRNCLVFRTAQNCSQYGFDFQFFCWVLMIELQYKKRAQQNYNDDVFKSDNCMIYRSLKIVFVLGKRLG